MLLEIQYTVYVQSHAHLQVGVQKVPLFVIHRIYSQRHTCLEAEVQGCPLCNNRA